MLTRAPHHEIEACARRSMAALAGRQSLRATLDSRLRAAMTAPEGRLQLRASEALLSAASLFQALAVRSGPAYLIGAARASPLGPRREQLAIQMLRADDFTDRIDAARICLADRWACCVPQVAGPGSTYAYRRLTIARLLAEAGRRLAAAEPESGALRRTLAAAAETLRAMDAGVAGLPESLAEWRQLMLNELDAEIFLYDLLLAEYAVTDCRLVEPG